MAPQTTKYSNRTIPRISMRDFPSRIDIITSQLVHAAEQDGFFVLTDHSIPQSSIDAQFAAAERFFALPDAAKARVSLSHRNAGWEKKAQIRPSTGQPDQKESYQMQFGAAAMEGLWLPEDELPGFRAQSLAFMQECRAISEKLMVCFARGLGFEDHYFVKAHDASKDNIQTMLRVLRYFALDPAVPTPEGYYRGGAHADWCLLALLFQRPGQSGLEICPGRELFTEFGVGDEWTKIDPVEGEIVCNM
jgi:isopenicillin N synthase-like dioxygenase